MTTLVEITDTTISATAAARESALAEVVHRARELVRALDDRRAGYRETTLLRRALAGLESA